MSRINVEDSLFADVRFNLLSQKIGMPMATGYFVLICRVAQRYWIDGCQLIPKSVWKMHCFPDEFIQCEIVKEEENGMYLCGSDDQFAWLVAKSNNGKKGGRPREINNITKATHKLRESYGKLRESYGNPPTPTPTPTQKEKIYCRVALDDMAEESVPANAGEEIQPSKDEDIASNASPNKKALSPTRQKEIETVIEYLNSKTGKNLRVNAKGNTDGINARLNDGYTVDDCLRVIDIKHGQWVGTKMERFIRPQTLFRPANFDAYLNESTHDDLSSGPSFHDVLLMVSGPNKNIETEINQGLLSKFKPTKE